MSRLGPEREQPLPLPLEARPFQGVAAIIVDRSTNLIYTVVETTNRPDYGKEAGMRTHPMETFDIGQTEDQALSQLFKQEVHETLTIIRTELIGYYGINIAAVRLFLVQTERNGSKNGAGLNHNWNGQEIRDPRWMKPEDLIREWVRMGVSEMVEDYLVGKRNVRRECKPVPLGLNYTNGSNR